ncbi:MAG: FGGY-family carbohydrate kinase [Symbiobacterium sp.]|uniref:L-fuculokinase n=1 Tax=Symbiobacterium sp. TaxID=1971213 RepID=UPI003463D378
MAVLIGIDVGTTHLKAGAFTPAGELLALATRPTPAESTPDGGAEYDPEALWAGVAACLREVGQAVAEPVASVGIASMAEAGVLVDADGQWAYPAIAWFDPRTRPQADELERLVGREALFRRTGLFLMPKFGLLKLLWIKEHAAEAYARGAAWLSMAEWVAFKLTGRMASCPTLAARTLAYDLNGGVWMDDLLSAVGVRRSLFREIVSEGAPLGGITADAASLTGLPAGVPVALAGHDHPCAALAAGVTGPGQMLISTGTAEAVIGAMVRPLLTPEVLASGISQGPLPVPGLYGLQAGASASGGSVEWLRQELLGGAGYVDLARLAEEAGDGPTGLLYLPHLAGGGPPRVNPASRGALVGLSYGTPRAQVVKAVLEGTAYELKQMVTAMEDLVGTPYTRVVVTGGQARNPVWLQIKADVLGRPLTVLEDAEATLLGAALLGGLGGGVYGGPVEAAAAVRRRARVIHPRADVAEAYAAVYRRYAVLAEALRPVYEG